jgi:cation-transporting P-type ATPase F
MDRPPRPIEAPLLDWRIGIRTLVVSALIATAAFGLFEWSLGRAHSIEEARTIAVNTIVVVEAAYLFACRSLRLPLWKIGVFSNLWVWVGASLMLGVQMLFTYLPTMNTLFHTSPIEWIWWVYFTIAGMAVLAAVEGYKVIARRWGGQRDATDPGGRLATS